MAAFIAAQRTGYQIPRAVSCRALGVPDDVGLLTAIRGAIPYPSAALAEADLTITRRILALLLADESGLRARRLSWLGVTCA